MKKVFKIILSTTVLSLIGNVIQCYQAYLTGENVPRFVTAYPINK